MPDTPHEPVQAGLAPEPPPANPGSREAVFKAMSAAAKAVALVIDRQAIGDAALSAELVDQAVAVPRPPPAPPVSSRLIYEVLQTVTAGIQTGADISSAYPTISRLIHNNEQRANVVNQLLLTHEFSRAATLSEARDHLENELVRAAYRGDMTPAERLCLMTMLDKRLKESRGMIANGAQPIQDIQALLERVNYVTSDESGLKERFKQTSPQGREIIRRMVTKIQSNLRGSGSGVIDVEDDLP